MSTVHIRAALEVALNAMSPPIATAYENSPFKPVAGTPYQQVNILLAPPDNETFGTRHIERGFMQVKLMYPLQVGTAVVAARAEAIRTAFKRGNSFTSGGLTVRVEKTPEVSPGSVDGDRWSVPVKVRFFCNVN